MALFSLGKVRSAALTSLGGGVSPIAIDFGVGALKLLQVADGDAPGLVAAAAIDTPEALWDDHAKRLAFQFQALPRLLKGTGFKGKRAVCGIPAGQMFVKHMQFPRADNVSLEDLVREGVPAALNCVPEALILRHFAVEGACTPGSGQSGGTGVKQEVICMAASREFVGRLMGAIKDAKLECVGIHPECVATMKAFEHINRRVSDQHTATMYLDIASGTTKAYIAHASTLVFAKTIQFGGNEMDLFVARALDLNLVEARRLRLSVSVLVPPAARPQCLMNQNAPAAAGPTDTTNEDGTKTSAESTTATAHERRSSGVAPGLTPQLNEQQETELAPPEFDLSDTLDTLTDEASMCLRYYEAMFPGRKVEKAILFGGEARHRGLCQHVARKLRLPTHVADPLARMARTGTEPVRGVDFTTPQPGWTVPFGLALCPTDL